MSGALARELESYHSWKGALSAALEDYRRGLDSDGPLETPRAARLYELAQKVRNARLVLAFVAEFSRGKSELINALLFADLKERLLPSDVGRTTMCPTEIFHDPAEPPYLRLLPIETRRRAESIAALKELPHEWSMVRLKAEAPVDTRNALQKLTETRRIAPDEARALGLLEADGPYGDAWIEAPAWRYALVNYPHPLLSRGLAILDTPGLNALGIEPELTLATLPNAHAALFILGVDTGVTRSDLDLWQRHVQKQLALRIAVLNKIDLTWDDLRSAEEAERVIARQRETSARLLGLPPDKVLAISAQKALVGRVRGDSALVAKSGIERLEALLASDVIPVKRTMISDLVRREIGAMLLADRSSLSARIAANVAASAEFGEMAGKSRDMIARLWSKIERQKQEYNAALADYRSLRSQFDAKSRTFLDRLTEARLDEILAASDDGLAGSWTTYGMQRTMNRLFSLLADEFTVIQTMAGELYLLMRHAYRSFQVKFNFELVELPALALESHRARLLGLARETETFCREPGNVAMPKAFLLRKFHQTLVAEARRVYLDAKADCDGWVPAVVAPVEQQLRDHKSRLQQRLDSLARINQSAAAAAQLLALMKQELADLKKRQRSVELLVGVTAQS